MGIVNINDDSFCNDGTLDPAAALIRAEQQIREGADVIDIGAESARTNRGAISIEEEIGRLLPFMAAWPERIAAMETSPWDREQLWPPLLSINTWRPEVVAQILPHGGDIINDLSALPDARNAELCAQHDAALLIMHSIGQPKVPHTHVSYPDIMATLETFFTDKIEMALHAGLTPGHLILDPGIDFAKQCGDNLHIFRELEKLHRFNLLILLPVSRKTVIGEVLKLPLPQDRDAGTIACIAAGMNHGVHIFRVHHVKAAAQAIKVLWSVLERSPN